MPLPTIEQKSSPLECDTMTSGISVSERASVPAPKVTRSAHPRSALRRCSVLMTLALSLLIAALEATVVATAVPTITHELGTTIGYTWVGGAYLLAEAASSPIWARISDIWGRRYVMLAALFLFFVASIGCAQAQNMVMLIAGRAVQGVAGGGLVLMVHVVISDLFSLRDRSLWIGLSELVWAVAGGLGPPLGGLLASSIGWRWCFYINLPLCAAAFVLTLFSLDVRHENTSLRSGFRAMDWYGTITFLVFIGALLLGLDFGGVILPWSSPVIIGLITGGMAIFGVFIWVEAKVASNPLIPTALFCDTSNLASLGVAFFHGLTYIPGQYYLPLYLQAVKGASPVRSGLLLSPLIVATAVTGLLSGAVIYRTGRFRELIWVGTVVMCVACGMFTILCDTTTLSVIVGVTIAFGLGSGLLFEPPLIALQSRCKQMDIAAATSTLSFCRSVALSISVVVGGAVFQNSMAKQSDSLAAKGLSATTLSGITGKEAAANVGLAASLKDSVQRIIVEQAFSKAMSQMWDVYTVLAVLGLLCGVFVGKAMLSKDHVETITGLCPEQAGPSVL